MTATGREATYDYVSRRTPHLACLYIAMTEKRQLSEYDLAAIMASFPKLPSDYIEYLRNFGFGETPTGKMIYSGPVLAREIYGPGIEPSSIVLLGDDLAGYCLGYDLMAEQYGEMDGAGRWMPWSTGCGVQGYARLNGRNDQ